MKTITVILDNLSSIKKAEKQKQMLENQGYTLVETNVEFGKATMVYSQNINQNI